MAATETMISGTRPVPEAHAFDQPALERWMAEKVPGFQGPLTVSMFKGGQSNPTYHLSTPRIAYVMRAKPGPASRLLPSAHAIEREYTVMRALGSTDVPVPDMLALCEDETVLGRAFYIMSYVDGRVLWDPMLPGMSLPERAAHYDEMNRVIAALHTVDPNACGLAEYGRPGNYFERQIARWTRQYQASETGANPAMHRLMAWLPDHLPESAVRQTAARVVHGDFRIDNLLFHPNEPRVLAVLDWELSTLGHPLADFSYHCMVRHIPAGTFRGMGGVDLAALGIPLERDYIQRYCARTGEHDPAELQRDWDFYLAYNLFRIAAILQGIAKRIEEGTASSATAAASAAGARPLADLAWTFAEKFGRRQT